MKTWEETVKEYYRFKDIGKNDYTYKKYFDALFSGWDINKITKEHQSPENKKGCARATFYVLLNLRFCLVLFS